MKTNIFALFENGSLAVGGKTVAFAEIPWNEHKSFPGVFLKNVVPGNQTQGHLNCHLVRINPGMKIGWHAHPDDMELHEVISGSGSCLTEQGRIPYAPGSMVLLARNAPHEVVAGEDGLCLLAKFIAVPAP